VWFVCVAAYRLNGVILILSLHPLRGCERKAVMNEPNPTTLSFPLAPANRMDSEPQPPAKSSSRRQAIRPSIIALFGVLTLFTIWGSWRLMNSLNMVQEMDSPAELDEIDSVTPLFEPATSEKTSLITLDRPRSTISSTTQTKNGGSSQRTPASSSPITAEQVQSSTVWLTGIIEDDEPTEAMHRPQQISNGLKDSTTTR
jgi:hypothetical protein